MVTREHPTRGTEVVIIHRKRYDDWTLPKGKLEAGESVPACAVREVLEETGVTIRLGMPLDTIRYEAGKAGLKKVDYWGGTVLRTVRRAPDAEVDVVSWLPVRAAMSRLTYAHDHFLLTAVPGAAADHPAAHRPARQGDGPQGLVPEGRQPARSTPAAAGRPGCWCRCSPRTGSRRLVSSTSTRCVSTLTPYAHGQRELEIDSYAKLSEEEGEHDPRGVAKLISQVRAAPSPDGLSPTAICVHRPVLPHILDALEMARPPRWSPGSSWSPT